MSEFKRTAIIDDKTESFEVLKRISTGAENHVYQGRRAGGQGAPSAVKFLHAFGDWYLAENAKRGAENLSIFENREFNLVPTILFTRAQISGRVQGEFQDTLVQPFAPKFHSMKTRDLKTDWGAEQFLDYARKLELVYAEDHRGIDYVGGVNNLLFMLRGFLGINLPTRFSNLIVLEEDFYARANYPELNLATGDLIAEKEDMLLCDTGMLPLDYSGNSFFDRGKKEYMELACYASAGYMWGVANKYIDSSLRQEDQLLNPEALQKRGRLKDAMFWREQAFKAAQGILKPKDNVRIMREFMKLVIENYQETR